MGWHKTDVAGKVMWEGPGGERVSDRAHIDSIEGGSSSRPSSLDETSGALVVSAFVLGLILGMLIGYQGGKKEASDAEVAPVGLQNLDEEVDQIIKEGIVNGK